MFGIKQGVHGDVEGDLGRNAGVHAHRAQGGQVAALGGLNNGDHAEALAMGEGDSDGGAEHAEDRLGR